MELISHKIIALVVIGAISLFFGLLPLKFRRWIERGRKGHYKSRRQVIISVLLCFGSGVLLATVFIHILPETREGFDRAKKAKESIANAELFKNVPIPSDNEAPLAHMEELVQDIEHKRNPRSPEDPALAPEIRDDFILNTETHHIDVKHSHQDTLVNTQISKASDEPGLLVETPPETSSDDHVTTDNILSLVVLDQTERTDLLTETDSPLMEEDQTEIPFGHELIPVTEEVIQEHDIRNKRILHGSGDDHDLHQHIHDHHVHDSHDHDSHIHINHDKSEHVKNKETHPHNHEDSHDHLHHHDNHDHHVLEKIKMTPEINAPKSHNDHHHNHDEEHFHDHPHDKDQNHQNDHNDQQDPIEFQDHQKNYKDIEVTEEKPQNAQQHNHEHDDHLKLDHSHNHHDNHDFHDHMSNSDNHDKEAGNHHHDHHGNSLHDQEANHHHDHHGNSLQAQEADNHHHDHGNSFHDREEANHHHDHGISLQAQEASNHHSGSDHNSLPDQEADADHHDHDHFGHGQNGAIKDPHHGHDHDDDHEYPFPELTICLGFFLIYIIEEIVHKFVIKKSDQHSLSTSSISTIEDDLEGHLGHGHSHLSLPETRTKKKDKNIFGKHSSQVYHGSIPGSYQTGIQNLAFTGDVDAASWNPTLKDAVTSLQDPKVNSLPSNGLDVPDSKLKGQAQEDSPYPEKKNPLVKALLEHLRSLLIILALSIHGIFEGLVVGLQENPSDVWYISFAILAHHVVISFCMGMEFIIDGLPTLLLVIYILVLSLVAPIGTCIGLLITDNSSLGGTNHELIVAILQGLSGGTILYVVFFEIMERERQKRGKTFTKLISLLAGFALMAIIEAFGSHSHGPIEDMHH